MIARSPYRFTDQQRADSDVVQSVMQVITIRAIDNQCHADTLRICSILQCNLAESVASRNFGQIGSDVASNGGSSGISVTLTTRDAA